MKIENARYQLNKGYPLLEVTLDGTTYTIDAEQKPTLVRHGLISVPRSPYRATLLGQTLSEVSNDPQLFHLVTAFGIDVYHKRFQEGPVSDDLDPVELQALGNRLERYARPESPSWADITALFLRLQNR